MTEIRYLSSPEIAGLASPAEYVAAVRKIPPARRGCTRAAPD
jgi:hypothetical protein